MSKIFLILSIITFVLNHNIKAQSETEFEPVNPTGMPYSIIIADISLNGGLLPDSTEIAVFDDTLCVGYTKYSGNINQQLVAWEGDQSMGLAGFTSGHTMLFKVRLFVNTIFYIIDAVPTYSQGTGEFGYGNFTVVDLSVTSTVNSEEVLLKKSLFGYPNPFNKQIYFRFNNTSYKTVNILDYTGKIIYSNNLNPLSNHFTWSGLNNEGSNVSDGLYFIEFVSDTNIKIAKVIYQRTAGYQNNYNK